MDNFDNFRQFFTIFTMLGNLGQFLQFLTIFDNFDNFDNFGQFFEIFDNFCQLQKFLKTLAISENFDTPINMWPLRQLFNPDNWEPGFMTICVTRQSRVTLDSIRNSFDVLVMICFFPNKKSSCAGVNSSTKKYFYYDFGNIILVMWAKGKVQIEYNKIKIRILFWLFSLMCK